MLCKKMRCGSQGTNIFFGNLKPLVLRWLKSDSVSDSGLLSFGKGWKGLEQREDLLYPCPFVIEEREAS